MIALLTWTAFLYILQVTVALLCAVIAVVAADADYAAPAYPAAPAYSAPPQYKPAYKKEKYVSLWIVAVLDEHLIMLRF